MKNLQKQPTFGSTLVIIGMFGSLNVLETNYDESSSYLSKLMGIQQTEVSIIILS